MRFAFLPRETTTLAFDHCSGAATNSVLSVLGFGTGLVHLRPSGFCIQFQRPVSHQLLARGADGYHAYASVKPMRIRDQPSVQRIMSARQVHSP